MTLSSKFTKNSKADIFLFYYSNQVEYVFIRIDLVSHTQSTPHRIYPSFGLRLMTRYIGVKICCKLSTAEITVLLVERKYLELPSANKRARRKPQRFPNIVRPLWQEP